MTDRHGFGAMRHHASVLHPTVDLVLDSSFVAVPGPSDSRQPWWPFIDPDFMHFTMRRGKGLHKLLIGSMLASPASFRPTAIWALFWAIAQAEHEFLQRFVRFWSHEERLTGHLVGQMMQRLEDFGIHWRALSDAEGQPGARCALWYADTATNSMEAQTGADLGLIVHAHLGGQAEYFKVARFQAKKTGSNGHARIDLDQVEALMAQENLGYFLFYHPIQGQRWTLPPTVRPATTFRGALEEAQKSAHQSSRSIIARDHDSYGMRSLQARDGGWDLASFITFALADAGSEHGVLVDTPSAARAVLFGQQTPLSPPSRVLVVSLGSGLTDVAWDQLLGEHLTHHPLDDEG